MISLKLYPKLYRQIRDEADRQGISVAALITRHLCQIYPTK